MSHTTDLLDRYKAQHGIESDYALAKALDVNPNRLSNYRCGLSHADDRMAVLLADGLGLDRFQTIAKVNGDRAKDAKTRAFWKRLASAASVAAVALLTTLPSYGRVDGQSLTRDGSPTYSAHAIDYAN